MWCENFHRYIRLPRHCSVPIAYILSVYGLVVVRFVDGIPKKYTAWLTITLVETIDRLQA